MNTHAYLVANVLRIGPLCIITRVGIYSEERPTAGANPFGFESHLTLAAAAGSSYAAATHYINNTIRQRDELARLWREYGPGTSYFSDNFSLLTHLMTVVRGGEHRARTH